MARILVADDANIIRLILKKILEELGHQIVGLATDGDEAVEMYKRFMPDLSILDVQMPNSDGFDALLRIKEIDEEAKVILISSFSDAEYINGAKICGASAYILKPITLDKIYNVLNTEGF